MNYHGLLVIDKPSGITSRDAVDRAQKWFPRGTRIGHTGTLDPLASGVLVLCIGAATRLTEYVQAMPKVYRAEITLGATSDTDDADGVITPTHDVPVPTRAEIEQQLGAFLGEIPQVPPAYSAAKVTGRRAYALARQGMDVQLASRVVRIDRINIVRFEYPQLEIVVHCGKGTYIRSIARDLGQRLGCGGYISALRRAQIGWFNEADAIALDADANSARQRLQPLWRALQQDAPIQVSDADAAKLLQGQRLAKPAGAIQDAGEIVVSDSAGRLCAVTKIVDGWLMPLKVLVLERANQ